MKRDGSAIDLGDVLVDGGIGNALARFLRHGSDGLAIAGGIALAAQAVRLYGERIDRTFVDIDFVAPSLDTLYASLIEEFICPHVHGAAESGKTLAQFLHPDDAIRIDIFRAIGEAQSRATPFRIGTTWIGILSLEDQAARAASVCMKLTRGGSVVAKHFPDFLRLQQLVSPDRIDAVWQEYRREFEPPQFVEAASQIEAAARTHPERLVGAAFNRDVNAVCPNCAAWGSFRPAEPARIIRILGYT
jgi:hypothetical protein